MNVTSRLQTGAPGDVLCSPALASDPAEREAAVRSVESALAAGTYDPPLDSVVDSLAAVLVPVLVTGRR